MDPSSQKKYKLTDYAVNSTHSVNDVDLNQPELFINRELSVIQFNYRVLEQAKDATIPLLERLKFLFICCSNLDEFFEVRVAGLKQQLTLGRAQAGPDGLAPVAVLQLLSEETHRLIGNIYAVYEKTLLPELKKNNICFLTPEEWSSKQQAWVKRYFHSEILPVLSPIGLDFAHPFPRLVNRSLNYIVSLTGKDAFGRDSGLAIVHAPRSLPRVIRVPDEFCDGGDNFVLLNSIIQVHAHELFLGMTVTGCYQFRITRNSDVLLDEDHIDDLMMALKNKLLLRRYGTAVRLEIDQECPATIADFLLQKHNLTIDEMYRVSGPVNLARIRMLLDEIAHPELRFPVVTPVIPKALLRKQDLFEEIRKQDILLHHPYDSFIPILDFIRQATVDPNVLAIKQTLYRTEVNSPMVTALVNAALAGKEVTAVIELRARFDEERNIELANRLQEAGALVIYGVPGFKTHAKLTMIVRREGKSLRLYAHLGTGNYHADTARLYTDFGLFTYNSDLTDDVQNLFQELTGMGRPTKMKKLLQAPFTLSKTLLELIAKEAQAARAGKPAKIMAKLNSLTDPTIIRALYEASQAGVKIELIVRGICALRPGLPGISDKIKVRSIVGRFLEHSRVYYFLNGGEELIFCASADWMERNLHHRVEVCFPIEDKQHAHMVKEEGLMVFLQDNYQAWELQSDGSYRRLTPHDQPIRCAQQVLLNRHSF